MRRAPGHVFGRTAEEYELGRPGWPEELVERALDELGVGPGASVLDLAAGTGKLTRLLAPRVRRVLAVEPDDEMRALLTRVVPDGDVLAGTAERIPLPDDSVDAVFVAEAFHWFDGPQALAEIARVLRPRGGLALLWNEPVKPVEPRAGEEADRVVDAASRLAHSRRYDPAMPLAADAQRDRVVETLRRHYVSGRLTVEDLAERTERALAARTTSDLRLTLLDLPRAEELLGRAGRAVRTGVYLVLLAGLWAVGSLALLLSLAVLLVAGERSAAVLLAVPVLWVVLTALVVRSGGRRLRRAA